MPSRQGAQSPGRRQWHTSWRSADGSTQSSSSRLPTESPSNSWNAYSRSMLALMEPEKGGQSAAIQSLRLCVSELERLVEERVKRASKQTTSLAEVKFGTRLIALPGKLLEGEGRRARSVFSKTTLWDKASLVSHCFASLLSCLHTQHLPLSAGFKRAVVLHCGNFLTESQGFQIRVAGDNQVEIKTVTTPVTASFGYGVPTPFC